MKTDYRSSKNHETKNLCGLAVGKEADTESVNPRVTKPFTISEERHSQTGAACLSQSRGYAHSQLPKAKTKVIPVKERERKGIEAKKNMLKLRRERERVKFHWE